MTTALPPSRPLLLDPGPQLALDDVLELLVDGQLERRPDGRAALEAAEGVPLGVGGDEQRAFAAADRLVVGRFQPAEADVVEPDVAEQVGAELAIRIEAAALAHEPDAAELQRRDLARLVRRDPALDVDERPRARQPLGQRRPVAALEHAAQPGGGRGLIVDFVGDRVDGVGVHAVGEQPAVAIENLAALGRGRDGALLLPFGAAGQLGVADHLQVDQPRFDAHGPRGEHRGGHEQPPCHRRSPVEGQFSHVRPPETSSGRPRAIARAVSAGSRAPARWPARRPAPPCPADRSPASRCAAGPAGSRSPAAGAG